MTAYAATVVFGAFIFGLLYRSSRWDRELSAGLWIPTLWVGIMASKPVMYWFAGADGAQDELGNYLDGNPIDRNILLVLIAAAVIVLIRRRVDWAAVFRTNRVLWLFYVYLAISIVWSEYPFVAFKRWIKDLGNIVMMVVILTEARPLDALQRVFVRCACVLVPLSVLFIKYFPEIGRYYHRWTDEAQYAGVTTNKNSLGVLAMISGLFVIWAIIERNKDQAKVRRVRRMAPEALVLAMCLWLLNLAESATASGCFLVGALTFFACRMRWARANARLTVLGILGAFLLAVIVLSSSGSRARIAESFGRDPTLTTRTDIWSAVLDLKTNVLFGAGYASVWLTPAGWSLARDLRIPHAHNGYLETYLNSGLVGVVFLLAVLLSSAKNAAWHLTNRSGAGPLFVAFVMSGAIYNFTEVTFNNNNAVGFILWLIALCATSLPLLRHSEAMAPLSSYSHGRSRVGGPMGAPVATRASVSGEPVGQAVTTLGGGVGGTSGRERLRWKGTGGSIQSCADGSVYPRGFRSAGGARGGRRPAQRPPPRQRKHRT